jgi:hypothetical protein
VNDLRRLSKSARVLRRLGERTSEPKEPTVIDLATITATVARDRVAEQFAGQHGTDAPAAAPAPVRRAAVRGLRALADRLDPSSRAEPAIA